MGEVGGRAGDTLQGMNPNLILLTLCQGLFFIDNTEQHTR
jgi:hypothetical protein